MLKVSYRASKCLKSPSASFFIINSFAENLLGFENFIAIINLQQEIWYYFFVLYPFLQ